MNPSEQEELNEMYAYLREQEEMNWRLREEDSEDYSERGFWEGN